MSVIKSATIIQCKYCEPEPSPENYNLLKDYLPADYEYVVCSFSFHNTNFKAHLRTNGKHQDHAHKWLEDFQMHSKCTMRVDRTYPHSGTKNVFKIDLRCQHNTRPRNEKVREKESCKNTDCPAKMGITIKRVVTERKSRSKDPHLPDYPTVIQMNFCHNHDILAPEILKHRSVHSEVKQKILNLFKLGHNPSTALDMHKYDLLLEYGENFEKIIHDRALLPDFQYCYRLYYKLAKKEAVSSIVESTEKRKKSHSSPLSNCENAAVLKSSDADTEGKNKKKRKLENLVMDQKELSKKISAEMYKFCKAGGVAGMLQVDESNSVMALCTPLMLRVHSYLKHSGEMVFVDRYGELEEPNSCHIYLFITYSCVGVLPLGCVMTTSNTAACLKAALNLWKQILPSNSFFNKSDSGPDIFYVSDTEDVKEALKSAFPKSHILLCISHILSATWSLLLDRKNTIKKEHRSLLFSKMKMMLFSQSIEELEMNYAYAAGDNVVKANPTFLEYLQHIYCQRHEWSLVFCRHLFSRTDDLSIFWQSAMTILKDPILSRSRTYNQLQVLDFMSRLDIHYERKLIDLTHDRFDSVRLSRFLLVDLPREAYTITQFSEIEYEVHNEKEDSAYMVDVSLGVCECRVGKTGAPCKHQLLVFRNFSVPLYDCVPVSTPSEKNLLFLLATGHSVIADDSEVTSHCVQKSVTISVQETTTVEKSSCTLSTDVIHDLVSGCSTNTFFLDEAGATVLNNSPGLVQTVAAPDSIQSLLSDMEPPSLNTSDLTSPIDPSVLTFSEPPQTIDSGITEIIGQICTQLKEKTSKSPSTFKPALQTFLKNLEKLSSSDSALEYALYTFGKFSKSSTPFFKRKVIDNKLVGFQSTAIEHKKTVKMFKTMENKV